MTAAAKMLPDVRYRLKFGERAQFCDIDASREDMEKFENLMLMAIERGTPLTRAECHAARNFDYVIGTGDVV
ncbi:MAG: hypothetical protein OXU29_07345 [Gammaproteobacteria bacterium]|nr:hypothetical protein [Gammaproteobacteria bacterium]MDD9800260.1 hypothetical protein [Gammaproteobacteria bacterium]MDD9851490.1 hypothetical protein [Gammaproteobacteria bacterium]